MKWILMVIRYRSAHLALLVALVAVTLLLVGGCTHTPNSATQTPKPSQTSGSSASQLLKIAGDKDALCRFVSRLNSEVNKAGTSREAVAAIAPFATQFDSAVSNAPTEIKPSVERVVEALRQALKAGTFDTINASSTAAEASAYKLDAYCGLK